MKTRLLYVLLFITSISFAQNFTDVNMSAFTDNVTDVDLTYDANGNMYVAYTSANDGIAYVKMFDGTNWINIGTGATPPLSPSNLDIEINPNTNHPWLLFKDNTGAYDIVKYDGSSWSSSINNVGGYTNAYKAQLKINQSGNGVVAIQTPRSSEFRKLEIFTNKSGSWTMEKLASNDSFAYSFNLIEPDKIVFSTVHKPGNRYDIRINELVNSSATTWDNTVLKTITSTQNKFARNLAASGHNNQVLYALFDHGGTNHRFRLMDGATPLESSTNKFDVLDYQYNSVSNAHYGIFLKNNNELIVQRYEESINAWTNENVNITATSAGTKAKLRVNNAQKVQVIYIESNKVKLKEHTPVAPQLTIYVDAKATGNNDGTSWADAYTNLQDAIDISNRTDQEIWVAAGTYLPTHNINLSNTNREKTFYITKYVKIYGGFAGTETNREDRNPQNNVTILSGDLNQDDSASNLAPNETTRADNSYHVVTLKGKIATRVILDGLTISGGNANATTHKLDCNVAKPSQYDHRNNAAINLNPVNAGDSIHIELNNCIIENNSAELNMVSRTSPCGTQNVTVDFNIYNSIVRSNYSKDSGAITVAGANGFGIITRSKMINSLFYENHSENRSSVLYLVTSTSSGGNSNGIAGTEIINCTIANNTSTNLKAVRLVRGNVAKFYNTIIYGNGSVNPIDLEAGSQPTVENCMLQGGQFGASYENPQFTDVANRDFTIQANSVAVDGGNNSKVPSYITTDYAGEARIKHNAVDIGAYESNYAKLPNGLYEFVDINATGSNNGSTWANAYTDLQTAIDNNSGKTILVAAGTYKPTTTHSNPRKATFLITKVVKLIGSLPAGTQTLEDQDITNSATILSGDLNGNDNANITDAEATRQDNTYHIVTLKGNFGSGGLINGFVITGGNSNGGKDGSCNTPEPNQYDDRVGAGIYSNPDDGNRKVYMQFINCTVEKNTGQYYAAFSRFNPCGSTKTQSHIDFIHSRITNNFSKESENINYAGSQRWDVETYGKLINTLIYNNETAATARASALLISSSGSVSYQGAASFVDMINCTITGNISPNNKAINMNMYNAGGSVYNTIIYGNGGNNPIMFAGAQPPMGNNLFEGGQLGSISGDPLFNGDFTLQASSPAIDAGNNSKYPTAYTTDLYGNDRIFNTTIDLGVYEYNPALSTNDSAFEQDDFLVVYPNPVATTVFIKSNNQVEEVKVFNLLGKQVLFAKANQINVSNLQQGVYLVRIKTDKAVISKKIIKK